MSIRLKLVFLIMVLVSPSLIRPQAKNNLTMSGIVIDQSRRPVPGAKVTAVGNKASSDGTTDAEGSFILAFGPDATQGDAILIQVEKVGYRPFYKWVAISSSIPIQMSLTALGAAPSGSSLRQASGSKSHPTKPLEEEDGPFTWTISVVFPQTNLEPNTPIGAYNLGMFIPDRDITVTRIVAPFAGASFVQTPNGGESCSFPAYFYLSSGPNSGVMKAAYKLALPNGRVPSGNFEADSGPISVTFPAGAEVTASYQLGFDAAKYCYNITNIGYGIRVWTANTSGVVPDIFTVQYNARRKKKIN
jgi:hypothetical protein